MLGIASNVTLAHASIIVHAPPSFSMSMDGTGDFLTFTATAFPISSTGDNLSISFWAKRDGTGTEDTVLSGTNASARRLAFQADGETLLIESDTNGHSGEGDVTADTNWHHYVVTSEGNDDPGEATLIFYEDGVAVTDDGNVNFGSTDGVELTISAIGFPHANNDIAFDGLLYQVAMFSSILSPASIFAMYNTGTPIPLQASFGDYQDHGDLLHLWRFNENTGTTTADEIGGLLGNNYLTAALNGNAAFSATTPTFDVAYLPNLTLWLKAGTNITADQNNAGGSVTHSTASSNMDDLDKINAWGGFGGTSINAVQTTEADKPRWETDTADLGALNFKVGIKFMDLSSTLTINANQDYTLVTRFKCVDFANRKSLVGNTSTDFFAVENAGTFRLREGTTTYGTQDIIADNSYPNASGTMDMENDKYVTVILVRTGGSLGHIDLFLRSSTAGYFDALATGVPFGQQIVDPTETIISNIGTAEDDSSTNFEGFISDMIITPGTAVTPAQREQIYDYIDAQ